LASLVDSDFARGDADRAMLDPAARRGEAVRPTTGGVLVLEIGGVGFLIEGLSQDEKKSSPLSLAGVAVPSAPSMAISVMTTSSGYLKAGD